MEQMLEDALLSLHKTGDDLESNDKLAAAIQGIADDYGHTDGEGSSEDAADIMPEWMESAAEWERDAVLGLREAYGVDTDEEHYDGYEPDDDEKAKEEIPKDEAHGDQAGTYGELRPRGILEMFRTVGAKPGAKYVDIGSGTGKTVALAWLMGLDATGVELSKTRYKAACESMMKLPDPVRQSDGQVDIRFLFDDIMNVDFSDADIVFANSVLMNNHTIEYIVRAAGQMKIGSKLVVYSSTNVVSDNLKLETHFETSTTWFAIVKYNVHTVYRHAADASRLHLPSKDSRPQEMCQKDHTVSDEL